VVKENEEVGVVVEGLVTLFIVIDIVDPFKIAATFIFTKNDVEFKTVHVEDILAMQELELVDVISIGKVTIIFEFKIRVFIVVNDKVIFVVTPIELFRAVTTALIIVDGVNVYDKVALSMRKVLFEPES
jgi:hypothetical protein